MALEGKIVLRYSTAPKPCATRKKKKGEPEVEAVVQTRTFELRLLQASPGVVQVTFPDGALSGARRCLVGGQGLPP